MQRLIADEHIGSRHITVKRHLFTTYPLHWHNYFEIELIVKGSGIYIYNGEKYSVNKGDAYILTPAYFHGIHTSSPIEIINISFDETYLTDGMRAFLYASDSIKRLRFDEGDFNRFIMATELLQHEIELNRSCITQLLEYILSLFSFNEKNRVKSFVNREHLSGINKSIFYMELHFREKMSLEKLSAISGYNPTYFSELFRKVTGETYIQRLKRLRINYAKTLLSQGLSVSDACFLSGFSSLSNFLTTFKEMCGTTPSNYRKGCGKSDPETERYIENSEKRKTANNQ